MVEVEELDPLTPAEDEEEEDISYNDLKRRMWKDKNLMEKFEKQKGNENDVVSLTTHRAEASRRKKMARSQDSVLKYMMKIMEVCKAKGFVYGIVPEKGKPITGSSDSLRRWWKENVQFDQTIGIRFVKWFVVVCIWFINNNIYVKDEDKHIGSNNSKNRGSARKAKPVVTS